MDCEDCWYRLSKWKGLSIKTAKDEKIMKQRWYSFEEERHIVSFQTFPFEII